jgi:hypothetical protein
MTKSSNHLVNGLKGVREAGGLLQVVDLHQQIVCCHLQNSRSSFFTILEIFSKNFE